LHVTPAQVDELWTFAKETIQLRIGDPHDDLWTEAYHFQNNVVSRSMHGSLRRCHRHTAFLLADWRGTQPVIGIIHDHQFSIRKRRFHSNSFAPLFYGTLREDMTGTLIEGHFNLPPSAKGFMIVWMIAAVYATMGGINGTTVVITDLLNFVSGKGIGHSYAGLPVLAFLLLGGIGVMLIGQLLGLGEKKYMLEFLERTLRAHRINVNDGNQ
jgi:hypothetical protein